MSIISNEHQSGSPFAEPEPKPSSHMIQGSTIVNGIGVRWIVLRDADTMQAYVEVRTTLDQYCDCRIYLNQMQQVELEESAQHVVDRYARTLAKAFAAGRRAKANELQAFLNEGKP